MLSCLITFSTSAHSADEPPSFFRPVLLALGWPHWTDEVRAADIWWEHRRRLSRAYPAASERRSTAALAFLPGKARTGPPLETLRLLLRRLDAEGDSITTMELYRVLQEADRLVDRISDIGMPDSVRNKLYHWRTVFRSRPSVLSEAAPTPVRKSFGTVSAHTESAAVSRDDRQDSSVAASSAGSAEHAAPEQNEEPKQVRDDHAHGREATRLEPARIEALAGRVREILQDTARAGATVTWGDLRRRTGGAVPYLHPDDQGEILVAVDRDTPADEPLLSALVAGTDLSPHGLYRHIRYSLDREKVPDGALAMHWRMDVFRLHQLWRHR